MNRITAWKVSALAYAAVIIGVAILQAFGLVDPLFWAATPASFHLGQLWRLGTSSLVIPQLPVINIAIMLLAGWRAWKLVGPRIAVTAGVVGHVCGTLINYLFYELFIRFTDNLADKLSIPDYGISLVWATLLGVVAGRPVTGRDRWWRYLALASILGLAAYDATHAQIQHLLAYGIGWWFADASQHQPEHEPWWRRWRTRTVLDGVSALLLINGLVALLTPLVHRFPQGVTAVLPIQVEYASRLVTMLAGFFMVYLSFNLRQRKHLAWMIATAGTAILLVTHLVAQAFLAFLVTAVVLAALLATRPLFRVRFDPAGLRRAAGLAAASIAVALLVGTAGFVLLDDRDFGHEFNVFEGLSRTAREFTLVGNGDLRAQTRHGMWFLDSLDALGTVTAVTVVVTLFRPIRYRFQTRPAERERAAAILARHGRSELDFFKLHPDNKSFFFARSGRAFVVYRVHNGVAVVLGDPVGPRQSGRPVLAEFQEFCHRNGWRLAIVYAAPPVLPTYELLDLRVLRVGQAARIDLDRFAAKTVRKKGFRHARNKFGKNYRVERHEPPHSQGLLRDVQSVSDEWLKLPGRQERGFGLGYFTLPYVAQTPLVTLRDPRRQVIAFVNEVPSYYPGEATIDLMRYRTSAPNGALDYLFSELLLGLRDRGFRSFDLGFAPLAGLDEAENRSWEEAMLNMLYRLQTGMFSFSGLQHYKDKFDPDWEDRYLVYEGGPAALGAIAVAVVQAMRV